MGLLVMTEQDDHLDQASDLLRAKHFQSGGKCVFGGYMIRMDPPLAYKLPESGIMSFNLSASKCPQVRGLD